MADAEVPLLQRFFEENPEYHLAIDGAAPGPNAAQEEFESLPPNGWRFDKKWILRFRGAGGPMVGMARPGENLFGDGVLHIGLFVIATRLHGSGRAWYE